MARRLKRARQLPADYARGAADAFDRASRAAAEAQQFVADKNCSAAISALADGHKILGAGAVMRRLSGDARTQAQDLAEYRLREARIRINAACTFQSASRPRPPAPSDE